MNLGRIVALVVGVVALTIPTAAHADTTSGRFESRDICVQRTSPTPGWRLGEAIKAWNATGLVNVHLRPLGRTCDPAWPHITVSTYSGADNRAGYADYVGWAEGYWSADQRWLYRSVNVFLNNTLRGDKCWGWYVSAHEIGHALGLPHNDSTESVMSYVYDRHALCRKPLTATDVALLAALGY